MEIKIFFFLSLFLVIVALIDRMGDAKDKVRDEAQTLILKLMDQVAPPMVGLHFKILVLLIIDEIPLRIDGNLSKSVPRGHKKP